MATAPVMDPAGHVWLFASSIEADAEGAAARGNAGRSFNRSED